MNSFKTKLVNLFCLLIIVLLNSFYPIITSINATNTVSATVSFTGTIAQNENKPPQQIALYSMPDTATLQRYTYATVSWDATASQVASMKAANPNLKLYAYRNFMCSNDGETGPDVTLFRIKGWLLKDANGKELSPTSIPTEHLVDPGNIEYRAWLVSYCQARKAEGYDGIFADNMPAPTYPASWTVLQRAINPRTGAAYTDNDWYLDSLGLIDAARAKAPIIGNGIPQADGLYGYWTNKARCDNIITHLDGVMVEGPVGWTQTDLNSRGETVWKQNIDFLKILVAEGKVVMFSNTGSSDMENDASARYVYCSYMMAGPAPNYSLKFRGSAYMGGSFWTSLVSTDLGAPLGDYYKDAATGDYVREFEGGSVRLNPVTKVARVITE